MKHTSKTFLTVDNVIIKRILDKNLMLLIKRKNEPFQNKWALPGGYVEENEDLVVAAKRELFEETQIKIDDLLQIGTFGKPFRDPRGHVVSVAFFGKVLDNIEPVASDDAKEVYWFDIKELPELAFDHGDIIKRGIERFLD